MGTTNKTTQKKQSGHGSSSSWLFAWLHRLHFGHGFDNPMSYDCDYVTKLHLFYLCCHILVCCQGLHSQKNLETAELILFLRHKTLNQFQTGFNSPTIVLTIISRDSSPCHKRIHLIRHVLFIISLFQHSDFFSNKWCVPGGAINLGRSFVTPPIKSKPLLRQRTNF